MGNKVTITAYSDPDYDSWGPDTYWSQEDWKLYYYANVEEFGEEKARSRWINAFDNPEAPQFGVARADYLNNPAFRQWLKENKLFNGVVKGLGGWASDVIAGGSEISDELIKGSVGLSKGVGNAAALSRWMLPIILILVLYLGYKFINLRYIA